MQIKQNLVLFAAHQVLVAVEHLLFHSVLGNCSERPTEEFFIFGVEECASVLDVGRVCVEVLNFFWDLNELSF